MRPGLRIEQYEYCGHSPVGLFVHSMLDVEPLELIEMAGEARKEKKDRRKRRSIAGTTGLN